MADHFPEGAPHDWVYWGQVINGFGALAAFIAGIVTTGVLAIWRLAGWSNTIKSRLDAQDQRSGTERAETLKRHADLLERFDRMAQVQDERHEANVRELDQIRTDVREIRAMASR